ncbi:MAG: Fe(2+)-trafficking protein, partial [Candidatus Acidiferrum sp.]
YRLGQLLLEDQQFSEAIKSFRRTLELSPQFSKVFQLLAKCLVQNGQRADAAQVLRDGFKVADERGDNMPRDEMAKMLVELGETAPEAKRSAASSAGPAGTAGFRCQRPGCMFGSRARKLAAAPMRDEVGKRVFDTVCADCWNDWLKNYSIKVINELHLDLSTERGQEEYDKYMKEYLGIESV